MKRSNGRPYSSKPLDLDLISEMATEGSSLSVISKRVGRSWSQVEQWLRRNTIKVVKYYPKKEYEEYYYNNFPDQQKKIPEKDKS